MFKTIILLVGLLSISFVFADAKADRKQARFEKQKVKVLEKLNTKISMLENNKSCVEKATKKEALKDCRTQAKEARKVHKEKMKILRAKNKALRDAKRAERKAKKMKKNQK